jgi:hypothetical protein
MRFCLAGVRAEIIVVTKSSAKWRLGLLEEGKIRFVIFPSEALSGSQRHSQADYSRTSNERFP